MAAAKSGPAMGLLTSKKYALTILFVTAASVSYQATASIAERCALAGASALVVVAYLIGQALVEREAVEHGTPIPEEEPPASSEQKAPGK